jgi:transcriptional regulator GlxA family with amidase domain
LEAKQAAIARLVCPEVAASVAEIAHSCGFTELGRFAGAYRSTYGESPSTTLRRLAASRILGVKFSGSA